VIPRIFHRVWLGTDPMPEPHRRYGETWEAHHHGWEMRLWTDEDLSQLECGSALELGRHHAERANLVRYEVLRRFGGVYVDTDMECLRSIEPLLEGVTAFAGYVRPGTIGNSVLGSVPGHPAFERASHEAGRRIGTGKNSISATGPRFLSGLLPSFPDVTLFEPKVFYPYDWHEKPSPSGDYPGAYAVHHWAMTGREESLTVSGNSEYLRRKVLALRRRRSKADRRADRAEHRAAAAKRRAREAERRLSELENSLWWRLHPARLLRVHRFRRRRQPSSRGS
jgi:hypothetical protein